MIKDYDTKKITLQLNTPLRGNPAGLKVKIETDKDGIPLDRYWRDRLKDAPKDGCITVVSSKQNKGV